MDEAISAEREAVYWDGSIVGAWRKNCRVGRCDDAHIGVGSTRAGVVWMYDVVSGGGLVSARGVAVGL